MKKALIVALVLFVALGSVFAGDFKFLFTELDQHPEILSGFLPTLTAFGTSYEGFEFVPGNLTQLQLTVGGGYTQRVVFQSPYNGAPLIANQGIYDCIQFRWNLKLLQGFGSSWVEGKDLVTVYAGYEGRYEVNTDSMAVGQERYRGYQDEGSRTRGLSKVESLDVWFDSFVGASKTGNTIYPDLADDYKAFITNFYLGAKLNGMDDKMVTTDGFLAELKLQFAPSFLNKKASYYSITLNAVAAKTLYELKSPKSSNNVFSVVIIDRVNVNWTDGSKVPVYAQMPVSLGRKVRGFNTNSYNTNFTVVNNLDIRIAGPEPFIDGIFPRLNLFFDVGYYAGNYFNTKLSAKSQAKDFGLERVLCSVGAQLEVSFFDFIDLGFQVSRLVNGSNLRNPEQNIITGATFFLDF